MDKPNNDLGSDKKVEDAMRLSFSQMIATDALKETWINRYITTTAALFSAIGAIVAFGDKTQYPLAVAVALIVLSVLGGILNYVIATHILRLSLWEIEHGKNFQKIEEIYGMPKVFLKNLSELNAEANRYPPMRKTIRAVALFLTLVWLGLTVCFAYDLATNFHRYNAGTLPLAYTLYRNSVVDGGARIHVATFDATEKEEYNRGNCEQAQSMFQAQPGIKTKFWCEKGRYRK